MSAQNRVGVWAEIAIFDRGIGLAKGCFEEAWDAQIYDDLLLEFSNKP